MSNSVSLVDDDYGTVIDQSEVGNWSVKPSLAEKMVDILEFVADKDQITTEEMSDKLSDIVVWTASEDFVSTNMVVSRFGIDERNARRYLTRLVDLKFLSAEGENKNNKYRYRK